MLNFKFINEGNGMEGIVETGRLAKETSKKPKVAITEKSNLVWDPVFECFTEREDKAYELEKGTVTIKK